MNMSINPLEEELRRLTTIKCLVRKEIDTTKDMKKKEMYRKRYERISDDLDRLLNQIKIYDLGD